MWGEGTMKRAEFTKWLKQPRLLDGAAGTHLMERGLPFGVCPEAWAVEHAEAIAAMHRGYLDAGAEAIYAFTFGANPLKLGEYGLAERMEEINRRMCQVARSCARGRALVAGDMTQTGQMVRPFGPLSFEEAVEAYRRQARILREAGVDFLAIETMMDIAEARAAVIGAREGAGEEMPILCTMTFDESGRTLTGSDGRIAAVTLAAAGADAVGANCGVGPAAMEKVIVQMAAQTHLPIVARPNAGLPGGDSMSPQEYAAQTVGLMKAGANAIGGCCGTGFAHIQAMKRNMAGVTPPVRISFPYAVVTSVSRWAQMGQGLPLCAVGERINPTGKKKLQAAIREGNLEYAVGLGLSQRAAGASALDVNVGMHGVREEEILPEYVLELAGRVDLPLMVDTVNPIAMERALRQYPGRAIVNSVPAERERMETLLPIVKKYGAMYVALPISEEGVPEILEDRLRNLETILAAAERHGLGPRDVIADALALTIASDGNGAKTALSVIDWCQERGLNSVMGVSNISFGLPNRGAVNGAMLVAAMARGMTCAILNPCDEATRGSILAANAIVVGGDGAAEYAAAYTKEQREAEGLFDAILSGDKSAAKRFAQEELDGGRTPGEIIDGILVPALDRMGELFSRREVFLPQLMSSADAAKQVFDHLEPIILASGGQQQKRVAVIATVEGDIHDIGKNIVGLMLKNNGFAVVDLGRDVKKERVAEAARKYKADVVGLSALLTTTMEKMADTVALLKKEGYSGGIMVGGAVVTPEFAQELGVHYSSDAAQAVTLAKALVGLK